MADERPIVVLGAGINGAALARELALSAVPVAVVDAADLASGATAWSTRLIHGGLRYLEHGEIGLVRESLAERDRLVRLAPHLVAPLPFYLPVRGRCGGLASAAARLLGLERLAARWRPSRGRGSWTVGIGLTLYDLLAAGSGWPRHRSVPAGGAGLPRVDAARFPLGCTYADAQMLYPERFTVELLVDARHAATSAGTSCDVFTRRRAVLRTDGVMSLTGADGEAEIELRPRAIVNATGAWVDRTLAAVFAAAPAGAGRLIGGTKGSHLLVRSPPLRAALAGHGVYAEADDGRPVFVLPFGHDLVLVGTTDIPFAGDPAAARADDTEIDYLLGAVARLFPACAPGRGAVQQHYCGVRPLPAAAAARGLRSPGAVTRRHMLVPHPRAPLPAWSIVGGKLTTCRSLAEAAAAEVLGTLGLPVRGSSRERPLPGACGADARAAVAAAAAESLARAGIPDPVPAADRLVTLFGARGPAVAAAAASRPGMLRGVGLPRAAVEFCVREEWARSLDDIVERRLMLAFDPRLCRPAIEDVALVLAALGLLSPSTVDGATEACMAGLAARHGRRVPTDTADHPAEEP